MPRPAAVAPSMSNDPREGNTTQSQSEGAVRGDRHCPLRNQVLYHLLKTQGFYKAVFCTYLTISVIRALDPNPVRCPIIISVTTPAGAEAQLMPREYSWPLSSQVPVDKVKASAPRLFFRFVKMQEWQRRNYKPIGLLTYL